MQRAFNLVEQVRDVVHVEPGPSSSEVTGLDFEGRARPRVRRTGETTTKRLVDHFAERATGPARERFELRRDILVERQRRPHTLMLSLKHHDVKKLSGTEQSAVYVRSSGDGTLTHLQNWLDCIRSRKTPDAHIRAAHQAARTSHLANAALRAGHLLRWNSATEKVEGPRCPIECKDS